MMACRVLRKIRLEKLPKGEQHLIDQPVSIGAAVMLLRRANQRLENALKDQDAGYVLEEMQYNRLILSVWDSTTLRYQDKRKSRHVNRFVLQTHIKLGSYENNKANKLLLDAQSYLRSRLCVVWANTKEEKENCK